MKSYLSKEKTELLRLNSLLSPTEIAYEIADLLVAECVETGAKRTLDKEAANGVISESQNSRRVLKG